MVQLGSKRTPAAIGISLFGALNVWSLLVLIYIGRVPPVRHGFLIPKATDLPIGVLGIAFVLGALWIGTVVYLRSLLRSGDARDVQGSRTASIDKAWIPAAVAPAWMVLPLHNHPRLCLVILCTSILLTGWTAARLTGIRLPYAVDSNKRNESSAITQKWWRDAWFSAVLLVGVALAIFHTYVQVAMYRSLQYGSPDIGYFAEMLNNVLRGRGLFCEAFGHSYFGEHMSPGLYLLVPLWSCFPRIELLMFIGAAAVVSACVPIYGLARRFGSSAGVAAMLAFSYLLYPSTGRVIYGAQYGFHEVLLVIPLMLWSLYFYTRRRWKLTFLFVLLSLSMKENIAIVYGGFGLYVVLKALTERDAEANPDRDDNRGSADGEAIAITPRRHLAYGGVALALICIAYFAICIAWIVPSFRPDGEYSKYYLYQGLGGQAGGILSSFINSSGRVVDRLLSWHTFGYIAALGVPVGFVFLRRPVCLVALPTIAFVCLMDNPDFASIRFWHQSSVLPILWFATVQAVAQPRSGPTAKSTTRRIAIFVLCCACLSHYGMGFSPVSRTWRDLPLTQGRQDELLDRLCELIPNSDDVQATPRLAAHFYSHDHVYPLHRVPDSPPKWIILDVNDSFLDADTRRQVVERRDQLSLDPRYRLALRHEGVAVFQLRDHP